MRTSPVPDNDYEKDNHTVEQTHFHTGEITAVCPGEPATGGALVNVHVLQVHIHANDTPAGEKEGSKDRGNEERNKEREGDEERG